MRQSETADRVTARIGGELKAKLTTEACNFTTLAFTDATTIFSDSQRVVNQVEPTLKRQRREVCQRCGLYRPVKGWVFISFMENVRRTAFAPLFEECQPFEQARIKRNRRRRRGW